MIAGGLSLAEQLAAEQAAQRRHFALAETLFGYGLVAVAGTLLAAAKLAGVTPVGWAFVAAAPALLLAANYGMARLVRASAGPWHARAQLALDSITVSTALYGLGPWGHLLYAAYVVTPARTALHLGQRVAWTALLFNVAGFTAATALRVPAWSWTTFVREALALALVCVALIPLLARIVGRLHATRATLARLERGDLTVRAVDAEQDAAGFLDESVGRTAAGLAAVVRAVETQAADVAAMAQELAAAAQQLQASAQEIAANAGQPTTGTDQQRDLIGQARAEVNTIETVAASMHASAKDTEREIGETAKAAGGHGAEIARANTLLVTVVGHLDRVSEAVGALERGAREIGKIVDGITRIASQTDLLALNAAIEAARAGEAGRGFAVVADEVSGLANRVGQSARDIEELIATIKEQTTDAVRAMEAGTHEVEAGTQLVTNTLADLFIAENSRLREAQATGTSQFLETQLEELRQQLVAQERRITEYKERHLGELPEQREANLRTLERLQGQLQLASETNRRANERMQLISQSLQELDLTSGMTAGPGGPTMTPADTAAARLALLREELVALQTRYSDRYPDVVQTREQIRLLEEKLEADRAAAASIASRSASPPTSRDLRAGTSRSSATCGDSTGRRLPSGARMATAPAFTAAGTKSRPSSFAPGSAANSAPGASRRESSDRSRTSTVASPACRRTSSMPRIKSFSLKRHLRSGWRLRRHVQRGRRGSGAE